MPSGYSGTLLAKKLGIKEGYSLLLHNAPDHYFDLFADMPEGIKEIKNFKKGEIDFIHVFYTTIDELKSNVTDYIPALKKNGMPWVSWPKGASKIPTDLKRDPIRNYILSLGLVDVKVAAIDEDWSGLKFVYRLKDRK